MKSSASFTILLLFSLSIHLKPCISDSGPVQDMCPTSKLDEKPLFINGFPCKNPANVTSADFKTSRLNHPGDTDNFFGSSVNIITAADFLGLNTLGLSVARTDLGIHGMVLPHSHPRASEMFYVSRGIVMVGFLDTHGRLFQEILHAGDAFIFPRGLLHYCVNAGFDLATAFSVMNSQSPGVVKIDDAMFIWDSEMVDRFVLRIRNATANLVSRTKFDNQNCSDQ
ncbi:hypothetical protein ACLOJK_023858 [Asimina triloba]